MKTPPRLLLEQDVIRQGARVPLDPAESAHVSGALRGRVGDGVLLIDGAGTEAEAVLVEVARSRVIAEVGSVRRLPPPEGDGVTLALAVVDRQPMDWAVQKAVEVGARRFVPLLCERTQHRRRDLTKLVAHWRRVSLQALKQCRRSWAMELTDPQPLRPFGDRLAGGRAVVADPKGRPLSDVPPDARGVLVVGPEGGWAPSELELFAELGWPSLRLAVHILRAETAAVVGAALLVANSEHLL